MVLAHGFFKINQCSIKNFLNSVKYLSIIAQGMLFAVFEEFILCILICIVSIICRRYELWLGCFIAYTIHLIIHLLQAIILKKYIPALATSIIALPISVWLIYVCIGILEYSTGFIIIYTLMGGIMISINLMFAHWMMHKFSKWQENFLGER